MIMEKPWYYNNETSQLTIGRTSAYYDHESRRVHRRLEKILQYNYDIMTLNSFDDDVVEDTLNRWLLMFLEEN